MNRFGLQLDCLRLSRRQVLLGSSLGLLAGCSSSPLSLLGRPSVMPGVATTMYQPPAAPTRTPTARTSSSASTHPTRTTTQSEPVNRTSERSWRISTQQAKRWKYIVVHHSSTASGSAAIFHKAHLRRGWRNGLGYHFVICNGQGGRDGEIQVGPRWTQQLTGAHTGNTPQNLYNSTGIGISLVGNFMTSKPTAAQLRSLERLGAYLASTCHISANRILAHRDAPGAHTDCCGDHLYRLLHSRLKTRIVNG